MNAIRAFSLAFSALIVNILALISNPHTRKMPSPPHGFSAANVKSALYFRSLMPNTQRRRDSTVELRRVGVGSVDECRRIRSTIWKLATVTRRYYVVT